MPLVMAGNFAVVFKLRLLNGTRAVKCFCRFLGDREARFIAIHKQLAVTKPSSLTGFEYLPRGILVAGKRYPILLMDWIDGPTLNVYIEEVLTKKNFREALGSLAEEWCRVVKELDDCHIAHGDLQHGNIIVTPDGIRLVDLDGTFVPGLAGQKAAELGHNHYQHPKRSEHFFDAGLDRFSSLVIYLSLIAIAERPTLWKIFHDENLIFTKNDFTDPARSPLFQALDAMGGTVAQLAHALKQASLDDPSRSPGLSDLIVVKQRNLPSWMYSAPIVVIETKTREASNQDTRVAETTGSLNGKAQPNRQWPASFPQSSSSTPSSPSQNPLPHTNQWSRAPSGATANIPPNSQQPVLQASSSATPTAMPTQPSPISRRRGVMDYLFAHENIMVALLILYAIFIFPFIVIVITFVHGWGWIRS
jgi:serine/threonine protein kinase